MKWIITSTKWWLVVGLAILPMLCVGQVDDCKTEIRGILKGLSEPDPGNAKRFKMQLSLTVAPKDSQETGLSRQVVTMACGDGKVFYESKEMCVYADAKLTVNILPLEKTVYLSAGLSKREKMSPMMNFSVVDSRLLEGAEVVKCGQAGKGNSLQKVLEITKGSGSLERYGIKSVRYVYDPSKSRILEVRATYLRDNALAYVQIQYEVLDMAYSGEVLPGPVQGMVFSSGNTLQPRYKGYKVIKTDNQL